MELPDDLHNWLQSHEIIGDSYQESGIWKLDQETTDLLQNGTLILPLIKHLQHLTKQSSVAVSSVDDLKIDNDTIARLQNWGKLATELQAFGISIGQDIQSLLVSQEADVLLDVLTQIRSTEYQLSLHETAQNLTSNDAASNSAEQSLPGNSTLQPITPQIPSNESSPSQRKSPQLQRIEEQSESPRKKFALEPIDTPAQAKEALDRLNQLEELSISPRAQSKKSNSTINTNRMQQNQGGINIEKIDAQQELSATSGCLEFLLVSFWKAFELNPKQAAGLMTSGNKYLQHVILKGFKGSYDKIVTWYQSIHSNTTHLVELIQAEEANQALNLILSAFRPGFLSRSLEVAQWWARVFMKMGSDFNEADMSAQAWDWFIREFGGIDACLLSLNKFGFEIRTSVIQVFTQFAADNFLELFTLHIRNAFPDPLQYFIMINEFIGTLCEIRTAKQEILDAGVFDYWLDFALRESDLIQKKNAGTRQAAITLLIQLWIQFPQRTEEREEIPHSILTALKRALSDKSKLLSFTAIAHLFALLETFSIEKNQYAPIIYKKLIFAAIENHTNGEMRELIFMNFVDLFDRVKSIPVSTILEPLIKQIQVAAGETYAYNTYDFELFVSWARHPRLSSKNAIQLLDLLSQVYLHDWVFTRMANIPFMLLAARFIDSDNMQEYLIRVVRYGLKGVIDNSKNVTKTDLKDKPMYMNRTNRSTFRENMEINQKLSDRQLRDNVLNLISRLIKLQNNYINVQFKDLLLKAHSQICKTTDSEYKPIIMVLQLLGDPQEMIFDHYMVRKEQEQNESFEKSQISPDASPRRKAPRIKHTARTSVSTELVPLKTRYEESSPENSRAAAEIERVRAIRNQRETIKLLAEEQKQKNFDRSVRNARKILAKEKRGVGFGETSRFQETTIQMDTGLHGKEKPVIKLRDFENDIKEHQDSVKLMLARYSFLLKILYKKYMGKSYTAKMPKKSTFDQLAVKNSLMQDAEFYKMLKDHGAGPMLTVQESATLMKLYNQKQGSTNLHSVNYTGYLALFAQTAVFIYSRDPQDLSNLPPGFAIKSLVEHFRQFARLHTFNTYHYDNLDPGGGDKNVIAQLNEELKSDPEAPMPEGYRRVQEKDIEVIYTVPPGLNIPKKIQDCIEILDDILSTKLFHFLEPQIRWITYYRAKGIMRRRSESLIASPKIQSNIRIGENASNLRVKPEIPQNLRLSPRFKQHVSKFDYGEQESAAEWAEVLNDVVRNVTIKNKSQAVNPRINQSFGSGALPKLTQDNRIQKIKKQQTELAEIEKEEKEIKRRLRQSKIDARLAELRESKEIEKQNTMRMEQLEKRNDELEEKARQEKLKRQRTVQAQKVKAWQIKKARDEEAKESRIKTKESVKKIEAKVALKERRQKISQAHAFASQMIKEELSNKERKAVREEKKRRKIKEKSSARVKEETKEFAVAKTNQEKITNLAASPDMQRVFVKHKGLLESMYKFFGGIGGMAIGADTSEGSMSFQGFNKFATSFNIWPGLVTFDAFKKLFDKMTKNKKNAMLSADDFNEGLIRIALGGEGHLNDQLFKSRWQMASVVGRTNAIRGVDGFTPELLEGLFNYIDMPDDPAEALDRLKNMKSPHPAKKAKV